MYTAGEDFAVGVEFEADNDLSPEEVERIASEHMSKLWEVIEAALGEHGWIGGRYDHDLSVWDESGHMLVESGRVTVLR